MTRSSLRNIVKMIENCDSKLNIVILPNFETDHCKN